MRRTKQVGCKKKFARELVPNSIPFLESFTATQDTRVLARQTVLATDAPFTLPFLSLGSKVSHIDNMLLLGQEQPQIGTGIIIVLRNIEEEIVSPCKTITLAGLASFPNSSAHYG